MKLSELVCEIYDSCEEATLATYADYEFPGRLQLVLDVWHELSSGGIDGMNEIKESPAFTQLMKSLTTKMPAGDATSYLLQFLRAVLLEIAEINDEAFQDDHGHWKFSRRLTFRSDCFETLFQFLVDAYNGQPTTRIIANLTGVEPKAEAPDATNSVPLGDGLVMKLSTTPLSTPKKAIALVREFPFSKEADHATGLDTTSAFEKILTAMRVQYSPHIGMGDIEKRLPLGKSDFPSNKIKSGLSGPSAKSVKISQSELQRFARFWQAFKANSFVLDIAFTRHWPSKPTTRVRIPAVPL